MHVPISIEQEEFLASLFWGRGHEFAPTFFIGHTLFTIFAVICKEPQSKPKSQSTSRYSTSKPESTNHCIAWPHWYTSEECLCGNSLHHRPLHGVFTKLLLQYLTTGKVHWQEEHAHSAGTSVCWLTFQPCCRGWCGRAHKTKASLCKAGGNAIARFLVLLQKEAFKITLAVTWTIVLFWTIRLFNFVSQWHQNISLRVSKKALATFASLMLFHFPLLHFVFILWLCWYDLMIH